MYIFAVYGMGVILTFIMCKILARDDPPGMKDFGTLVISIISVFWVFIIPLATVFIIEQSWSRRKK